MLYHKGYRNALLNARSFAYQPSYRRPSVRSDRRSHSNFGLLGARSILCCCGVFGTLNILSCRHYKTWCSAKCIVLLVTRVAMLCEPASALVVMRTISHHIPPRLRVLCSMHLCRRPWPGEARPNTGLVRVIHTQLPQTLLHGWVDAVVGWTGRQPRGHVTRKQGYM